MATEFEQLIKREQELSKLRGDLFTRWLGLPCSLQISRIFLHYRISENIATLLMWLSGIIGSLLIMAGSPWQIPGLLLLVFQYILDYVDGQLARQRQTSSVRGAVWDRWCHYTIEMLFFFALGFSLFNIHDSVVVIAAIFIIIFWNRFRIFIVTLPTLIYWNELNGYPDIESDMIRKNYLETSAQFRNSKVHTPAPEKSWRSMIRAASTSFNFLIFVLLLAAVADYILILFDNELNLMLYTVYLFAGYYLFNILDYSKDYLFTDRISSDLICCENQLSNTRNQPCEPDAESGIS